MANPHGCDGLQLDCDNGFNDSYDPVTLTAYGTGDWNKTVSFRNVSTLIQSMSVIHFDYQEIRYLDFQGYTHEDGEVVGRLTTRLLQTRTNPSAIFSERQRREPGQMRRLHLKAPED